MAEQKGRWNWEVTGFEPPRKSPEREDHYQRPPLLARRYSISTSSFSTHSELSKHALSSKLFKLKDKVEHVREDYMELRQEAVDLQEYSNAKMDRLMRYLGVLADKTRKLDQAAVEMEARMSPLIYEKKKLFNDLLTG
nr:kinesin-like protein KIN-14B [Coffea arabica]